MLRIMSTLLTHGNHLYIADWVRCHVLLHLLSCMLVSPTETLDQNLSGADGNNT